MICGDLLLSILLLFCCYGHPARQSSFFLEYSILCKTLKFVDMHSLSYPKCTVSVLFVNLSFTVHMGLVYPVPLDACPTFCPLVLVMFRGGSYSESSNPYCPQRKKEQDRGQNPVITSQSVSPQPPPPHTLSTPPIAISLLVNNNEG